MDRETLGRRIREQREARGLSQRRAAALVKKSGSWLSLVESGAVQPPLDLLQQLVEALGARMTVSIYLEQDPDAELLVLLHEGLPRLPEAERARVRQTLIGVARTWLQ